MAEMLVDSTKLDACLNAEADAIRAKTGDSNDIPFDFANNKGFADAIAAIPSGGGGVSTYSGDIVLQNVDASELVIPVDVTEKHFIVSAVCVESGTVSDGTVTIDEGYVTWNSEGDVILAANLFHLDFSPTLRYRYQPDVTDENISLSNETYVYGRNGRRGTNMPLRNNITQSSSIIISAMNATRKFCRSGLYFKFHYEVVVW